jgi:predicted RNA binding protein YcfA (HicA-like mRNA interferase family)
MAAEMGLGKSETELVAALEQNGWDENRAIGSLF